MRRWRGPPRLLLPPASRPLGRGAEVLVGLDEDAERFSMRLVDKTRAPVLTDVVMSGDALVEHGGASHGTNDDALAQVTGMRRNTFLQNLGRARKLLEQCSTQPSGTGSDGVTLDYVREGKRAWPRTPTTATAAA